MDLTRIEEAVDAALNPARAVIVAATRTAYAKVATKYHDPNDGCDAQTFGILVYKFLKHQITITSQDPAYGIAVAPHSQAFRFHAGGFCCGTYGLGWHAVEDIEDSFPNNDGAAGELALDNIQYWLQLGDDAYLPRSLVIGHLGNPETGCEQVWVAEPMNTTAGAICKWGWKKELWRWDGTSLQLSVEPILPAPVQPKSVVLTLKRSAKEKPTG